MKALITMKEHIDQHNQKTSLIENKYFNFFESMDIQLILLPNVLTKTDQFDTFLNDIDFIILSGGGDPSENATNRKFNELYLIDYAKKNNIPIVGICRGMQVFVNYIYKIPNEIIDKISFPESIPGNRHNIVYENKIYEVNHYHELAIFNYESDFGKSTLGFDTKTKNLEIIFDPSSNFLGFQWHPERELLSSPAGNLAKDLITKFVTRGD